MPINWTGIAPSDWMAQIPAATPISKISLPGAHDCTTQIVNAENPNLMAVLASVGLRNNVVCQATDITGLLNMGVRYLDLRLYMDPTAVAPQNLVCVHGGGLFRHYCLDAAGAKLTFDAVQAACGAFLALHPTETIIVSIKDEEPNQLPFEATLVAKMAAPGAPPWHIQNAIPPLAAVRGQLVLLRRFAPNPAAPIGIDLMTWDSDRNNHNENGAYRIPAGGTVRAWVQDEYNFYLTSGTNAGNLKWMRNILPSMADFQTSLLSFPTIPHINFTSCSNLMSIPVITATINPMLDVQCVLLKNTESCGWIVGDFLIPPLCQHIYEINN